MLILSHSAACRRHLILWTVVGGLWCLVGEKVRAEGKAVDRRGPSDVAAVAASEAQKRQQQVEAAQTLFTAGSKAFADQSYAEAMDYYKAAFETLPDVPAVANQRRVFFDRYQTASRRYAQILVSEAKWAEAEQTLAEVVTLADQSGIPKEQVEPELRKMLQDLRNRDDRYNFAMSPRHLRNVDQVETKLIIARGYRELGDYDRAERSYQEVLNIDPYNSAARRGMEVVERYRMNYHDAAYDHTRAKRLAEVAKGWETPVPKILSGEALPINADEVTAAGSVTIERKMREIIVPSMEFEQARLADVVEYLVQKSQELDASESDPARRGVNIVIDSAALAGNQDAADRPLTVKLSNVPLAVALRYAVEQVGLSYRVENVAVRVLSPHAGNESLSSRSWIVPPGFLSGGGGAGGPESSNADPFANSSSSDSGGTPIRRVSAQQFLQDRGVEFGPGASATYIAGSNTLLVRNTDQQLILVDQIVQASKEAAPKMVEIHVKMVSVEARELHQLGLDFLLGQSNLGSSARTFFSGGTDGNIPVPAGVADFPFVAPGGGLVGTHPVTGGLRTGNINQGQTIDGVIQRDSPSPTGSRAPGIFSVAGVFTDPQFQVVLRALSQLKGADFLSDSFVTVRPGSVATMEQVREFIYPTEYDPPEIPNSFGVVQEGNTQVIYTDQDPTFPATPANPTAFETRKVGKTIEVEPTVAADDKTINLNVLMDFTDFSGFINYGTPITNSAYLINGQPSVVTPNEILMPVFDAIKETTNVVIWDGQTVAIGGYHGESITTTEDKIPYLGDLPVLGRAFKSNTSQSTKRALTIFVTARLVDPGGQPINGPVEENEPELITRRNPLPGPAGFAPGPPPVMPAK